MQLNLVVNYVAYSFELSNIIPCFVQIDNEIPVSAFAVAQLNCTAQYSTLFIAKAKNKKKNEHKKRIIHNANKLTKVDPIPLAYKG